MYWSCEAQSSFFTLKRNSLRVSVWVVGWVEFKPNSTFAM